MPQSPNPPQNPMPAAAGGGFFAALQTALEPPEAFSQSGLPFWDDAHISQMMLEAHLDAAFDGASRRPAFMDASAAFIAGAMPPKEYPRLLDLGCGPGLYATRLAALGYAVTGLDISRRSIEFAQTQARAAGQNIGYRVQNYLQLDEAETCDAAILVYCDYGALSGENRALLLQNTFRALRRGGRFLLDVFTTHKRDAFKEEQSWHSYPKGGFWSAAPHLALQDNRKYPARVTLEHTVVAEGESLKSYCIWNQYFTQQQLAAELEKAGFTVAAVYDDAAGEAYTDQAETLAMLAEKPG